MEAIAGKFAALLHGVSLGVRYLVDWLYGTTPNEDITMATELKRIFTVGPPIVVYTHNAEWIHIIELG